MIIEISGIVVVMFCFSLMCYFNLFDFEHTKCYLILIYNRYNEPSKLLEFKSALFNSENYITEMQSFRIKDYHYYHFSKEVVNFEKNIEIRLSDYDRAIIWHWVKLHNKKLGKK